MTPANAPCDRPCWRRASVMVVPVASVGVGRNESAADVDGAEDDGCATTTEGMPVILPTGATEMVVSNGTAVAMVTALDLVENALMLWIGLLAKELLMLLKFYNLAEQHVREERNMKPPTACTL